MFSDDQQQQQQKDLMEIPFTDFLFLIQVIPVSKSNKVASAFRPTKTQLPLIITEGRHNVLTHVQNFL